MKITVNKKEALRYMGQRRGEASENVMKVLDVVCTELESVVDPKYVWREYGLVLGEDMITLGGISIKSAKLRRHLEGCKSAAVLAATLGTAADTVIKRAFCAGALNGAAAQAAGAAMIESVCDAACAEIAKACKKNVKPRFSAGYGDFDISYQKDMLILSDAVKRIGITLSGSLMMIPTKSVTAIVGLTYDDACAQGGCAQCDKKDCEFRT